jgi:hypothetical protein
MLTMPLLFFVWEQSYSVYHHTCNVLLKESEKIKKVLQSKPFKNI